jgi:hypothetical protein
VEDLGVDVEGGVVKTLDGCPVGGGEGDVRFPGLAAVDGGSSVERLAEELGLLGQAGISLCSL